MTLTTIALLCVLQPEGSAAAPAVPEPLTGIRFASALDTPLNGSWQNVELRTLVGRIAADRRIAVLIDRRLDPNQLRTFESSAEPLREAFGRLAEEAGGRMAVVGNVVYFGPPDAVEKLRTLIQLRTQEFQAVARSRPAAGKGKSKLLLLTDRNTLRWNDLDEPRNLLTEQSRRWSLTVEGQEQIPHDLWAAGVLPEVNPVEALSLLLIQFDRSFSWNDAGDGIRLVSVPERVEIEKRYTPKGATVAEAARRWQDEIPGLTAMADGREVLVRGTVEQHERLEALLRPAAAKPPSARPQPGGTPLARRTFTLRTQEAPASAILEKLKQSGIDVRFDAGKLKAAGVAVDKPISLNLNKASTRELFDAICRPIGAKFEIDGETVSIQD